MRIRIWNAYASNNSGSYTIVGVLPSEEVAAETARELAEMIAAHTKWVEALGDGPHDHEGPSPLGAFCEERGLGFRPGDGTYDDWPSYSGDNSPRVTTVGRQLIVHHEYTISLPRVFGELFYKRGGRVSTELNHAHHPLVATFQIYWSYQEEGRRQKERELPRVVEELGAPGGVLERHERIATDRRQRVPSAWSSREGFGEADLTVGAVFEDLVAGVAAVSAVAKAHGASVLVRVTEAHGEDSDPLAHLRPPASVPGA